jgi:glycerol kinase
MGTSCSRRGAAFVAGFLAGAWKLDKQKHEAALNVELRARVRPVERRQLKSEAEALLAFMTPATRLRRLNLRAG